MLPLPEHGHCILSKIHDRQSLLIEFYWQGPLIQNNNPGDKVCLYAGINSMWAVVRYPVFVYDKDGSNW